MDTVAAVLLGVGLALMGFMGGALFTDRRDRKQALTQVLQGERRVQEVAKASAAEVAALVRTINEAHNNLVKSIAEVDAKVESQGNRLAAFSKAQTSGSTQNPFAGRKPSGS